MMRPLFWDELGDLGVLGLFLALGIIGIWTVIQWVAGLII